MNYRKVTELVKVFFDASENYTDHRFVRAKIAEETREVDPEVAEMYLADTEDGYFLCELGHVIDRAMDIFGIEVYFQAGSAAWIGWDGMDGWDPDDFYNPDNPDYDDWEEIGRFVARNRRQEKNFMKSWPHKYLRRKAEWLKSKEWSN